MAAINRAYKKTLAGAVHTRDGLIVYAKLKMERGRWTADAVDSWPASNTLKTTLRLSGGAVLGLCAQWRRHISNSAPELPAAERNADINPCMRLDNFEFVLETLSGNITSLAAEDSFLLTLPLAFCVNPPESFLSVYSENGVVTFGVVIAKRLEAVFSFPCGNALCAEASAGRIRRYWKYVLKRDDFPQKGFILPDGIQNSHYDGLDMEPLALPKKLNGGGALKAAGAALAVRYAAPAFELPPQYGFRKYRSVLLKASAVLFCLTLITAFASAGLNAHAGAKLANSEKIYYSRLNENKTLQELSKTANELSGEIFSIEGAYTRSADWGNLLLRLSEAKPDGLFLERLGSDYVQGAENNLRIALSGWSQTETAITEFISGLHSSEHISNVSLSSMERDAKHKNIYRFKILCAIRSFKD